MDHEHAYLDIDVSSTVKRLGHESVEAYQHWYGLDIAYHGEELETATTAHLAHRSCGVPDFAGAEEAQWPRSCMRVTVAYQFQRIRGSFVLPAWQAGLRKWNETCGIELVLEGTIDTAKIWAKDGPLPGGTLAWSFLANDRCDSRLEQRYDTLVTWNQDFLAKTVMHEVGHAIGLQHSNDRRDIMYPSILSSPLSAYPGPGDVQRTVQRYGEPRPQPPRPDEPDPGAFEVIDGTVRIKVGDAEYRMQMIEAPEF